MKKITTPEIIKLANEVLRLKEWKLLAFDETKPCDKKHAIVLMSNIEP